MIDIYVKIWMRLQRPVFNIIDQTPDELPNCVHMWRKIILLTLSFDHLAGERRWLRPRKIAELFS